jgi:hypothetical protein
MNSIERFEFGRHFAALVLVEEEADSVVVVVHPMVHLAAEHPCFVVKW